jgi:hypothetical protein
VAFRRRNRRGIDAQIEQGRGDGATTLVVEMLIDSEPPDTIEGRHQRPVEEDEFSHEVAARDASRW